MPGVFAEGVIPELVAGRFGGVVTLVVVDLLEVGGDGSAEVWIEGTETPSMGVVDSAEAEGFRLVVSAVAVGSVVREADREIAEICDG